MVRNESFSPSDICICVRFDKYSTINRSCRGEGEGGEEEIGRGEGGGKGERVTIWSKWVSCAKWLTNHIVPILTNQITLQPK